MEDVLVSVIIPSYKGSELINKTIEGVKNQTYKNIEIIVVDDNGKGTDEQLKTEQVVNQFSDVVYLIHDTNRKGSAARNTGIKHSKGEYIAFLDDDDVWEEHKIEYQVKKMRNLDQDWGLIYGPFVNVYDDEAQAYTQHIEGFVLFEFLMGKARIGSSLMMIRKSVVDSVGYFDESFVRHQDWEYIARIALKYKIAYQPAAWTFKYVKQRNTPSKVEDIEKNRLYFLEQRKPIIDTLSEFQKENLYYYQYTFLAKENLRRKKLSRCFFWLKESKRPVRGAFLLVRDGIRNVMRKTQKKNFSSVFQNIVSVSLKKEKVNEDFLS